MTLRLAALAAALFMLLAAPPVARADLIGAIGHAVDDGVKKTKKVIKKVKKKVKKAGKEIEEEVEEEVEVVVNGAGKVVGEVDKTTGKVVRLALKGQKELEKTFSKDVVDDILESIDRAFKGAQQAPMWTGVVAKLTEAKPAALRAAADTRDLAERVKKAGTQWKEEFDDSYALIDRLVKDDKAQKRVGRLFQLVAQGKFNNETERLAQWVVDELLEEQAPPRRASRGNAPPARLSSPGAGSPKPTTHAALAAPAGAPAQGVAAGPARAPQGGGGVAASNTHNRMPAYPVKSVGVTLGWNVSAHIAVAGGFEGRFGVVMDVGKDGKVSDVRAIYTLAEGLGLGASATGAGIDLGVDVMVTMSALPVKNASGLFFGPNGSVGAVVSGNVGLEWGWMGGNPVPAPIPSISAGPGFTDPNPSIGVLVMYGYAVTANDKGFDHGIPGVPAK